MRKMILGVSAGLAALVSAAPAQAGVAYFQVGPNVTSVPSNTVTIANFDGTPGTGTFSGSGGVVAVGGNPPAVVAPVRRPNSVESVGNFAYVANGGRYTINFSPAQVFTFIFGSLNATNSLTLSFAGSPSRTFTGGQIAGLATTAGSNGQSGRFTYDAQGIGGAAGAVVSALFTSGTGSAFEFDNIATAAPEPAAWMLMILGFGVVGGALRRSRPARKVAFA